MQPPNLDDLFSHPTGFNLYIGKPEDNGRFTDHEFVGKYPTKAEAEQVAAQCGHDRWIVIATYI